MTRSARFFSFFILGLMLVSLFTVNVAKSTVNNPYSWGTLQGDAQRTGYTESPAPNSNQTFWKYQTGGPIICSPVTVAGIVFVSSTDGYLYAINVTTGVKIWDFWIGADLNSPSGKILHDEIVTENNGARAVIGRVTRESLSFYDISLFNVFQRYFGRSGTTHCIADQGPQRTGLGLPRTAGTDRQRVYVAEIHLFLQQARSQT